MKMEYPSDKLATEAETLAEPSGRKLEVSEELLDLFWGLAVTDEDDRVVASAKLMAALATDIKRGRGQDSDKEKIPVSLSYTVRRLIVGLSSSRQSAPLGFATSLCEVFRQFGSYLCVKDLLKTITQCLKTSNQDNRCHQTHSGLGQILACISLIRSGLIKEASPADLQTIVKLLSAVRTRFNMLASASTECLVLLCSSVDPSDVGELLMEYLHEELTSGWLKCSPDTLQLLLVLEAQHLARIMIQSTIHHPLIHPVSMLMVERAAKIGPKTLTKLWKTVLTGAVYNTEKPARCYMVYQIIPEVLRTYASSSRMISTILCPELIGPMMKQMTHRDSYLHQAAVKLMSDIVDVVKTSEDCQKQLGILRCFLSEPGSYMFDSVTSTRYLSNIISNLSHQAATEFSQDLMSVISKDTDICGKKGEGLVSWCSVTLVHMLTLSSVIKHDPVTGTWQTNILQFLLLHSCFVIESPQPKLAHCGRLVTTLSEGDAASVKDALRKGLSVMSTYRVQRGGSAAGVEYSTILHHLFKYACSLMKSSKHVRVLRPINDDELKAWACLEKTCKQISKKQDTGDEDKSRSGMYDAFLLMLELFGLLIFLVDQSERGEVIETINEIHACFDKAVSKTRITCKELEWCEVITEVLISLMSKSSLLLRSVSSNVFTKILPMCSVAAIQLILDVFQSEDDEFLEGQDDDMDDEEAIVVDETQNTAEKNNEEGSSQNGDSSSDDSDGSDGIDEEEDDDVDENMRAAVAAALGPAAVNEEASQEDDDDLSDSEMFKLDDALSEAFRSMRRRNKNSPEEVEKRRQIKYFKLRCLDLVDAAVKHSPKGEHLLEIVVPLLTLIEAGYKDKSLKEIGNKAHTIYSHLTLHKKLPTCCVTDVEETREKVKAILALSTNAYVWPIMKEISGSLNFMVKLLSRGKHSASTMALGKPEKPQGAELSLSNIVIREVHDALSDFLTKRESRYSHTLFQILFEKQPALFWHCSVDLVKSICDADIRIFYRTQACSLLMQLLQKNIKTEIGDKTWQEFSDSLVNGVAKVAEYSTENYKPGFLVEFFGVLQRTKAVDKGLALDICIFDPVSTKFGKDLQKLYRKLKHLYSNPLSSTPGSKKRLSTTGGNGAVVRPLPKKKARGVKT